MANTLTDQLRIDRGILPGQSTADGMYTYWKTTSLNIPDNSSMDDFVNDAGGVWFLNDLL